MNTIQNFFPASLIEATGWTIIHSLWQAIAIFAFLELLLWMLSKKSAQIRYFLAFAALAGILVWSSVTFIQAYRYANEKQIVKEQILNDPSFLKSLLKTDTDTTSSGIATANLKTVKIRAMVQRHFNVIWFIWLIGIIALTIRLTGGYLYTQRLRNYHITPLPDRWLVMMDELIFKMKISRKISAFFSPLANVPLTLGVFKPVILFPLTALTGLSPKEIEAVIAHELAHILRHDYLFNIIQSMIEIIFFYHPAIWIISWQLRAERENSCDNLAIAATGDKIAYAKALATVQTRHNFATQQLSMAFLPKGNNILQRIKRIQKETAMKTNFKEGIIAAGIIIGGLTLASFTIGLQLPADVSYPDKNSTPVALSKEKRDSICAKVESKVNTMDPNDEKTRQMKKVMEITYSINNTAMQSEIAAEIEKAMKEIDFENLMKQTMQEVSKALQEASVSIQNAQIEIDREEIKRDMEEARKDIEEARKEIEEDMRQDMKADGIDEASIEAAIRAASVGLDVADAVIGDLDIEAIVKDALQSASVSLEVLSDLSDDSTLFQPAEKEELEKLMNQLENEKKKIEQEQKKLKEQLKKMDK